MIGIDKDLVLERARKVIATADAIDVAREAVKRAIEAHDKAGEDLRKAAIDGTKI